MNEYHSISSTDGITLPSKKNSHISASAAPLSDITNISEDVCRKKMRKPPIAHQQLRSAKIQKTEYSFPNNVFYIQEEAMVIERKSEMEIELVRDIDTIHLGDPIYAAEYTRDIFKHCFDTEEDFMVDPTYMNNQPEIQEGMRYILVNWLVEVHLKFVLLPETMFLTVNMIDRFLSRISVEKKDLQLVGMTCMFIASKYEEIYPPECQDFEYIAANAYSKSRIFEMEQLILNELDFSLTVPTSIYFLRRFSEAAQSTPIQHTLCKYILELCMVDFDMLKFKPSVIAASSVFLSRKILMGSPSWNDTLQHYTTYNTSDLKECAVSLLKMMIKNKKNECAVYKKYKMAKFHKVADIEIPPY